ncbi:hypothetical protein DFH07DRAFT_868885 [Mycena maculata]|uniref:Uncharacterized protein n=1 Tax=Mycena maculata TaxID=230809 RepID=A0AAD7IYS8_9AGAR|nr:hypothetical protein DFH07DRAFT_868885 [Mycena maculata]
MSSMVCDGCGVQFQGRCYTLHLKMSTNPQCVAVSERESARGMPEGSDWQAPNDDFGGPEDHGLPIGEFTGDFFGDYQPQGLGFIQSDDEDNIQSTALEESESEDEEDVQEQVDLSHGYERPRPQAPEPQDTPMLGPAAENILSAPAPPPPPHYLAGSPISNIPNTTSEKAYESSLTDSNPSNPYAPFASKIDWEVQYSLDLSYGNSVQLNKIIDEKLPGRPKFVRSEVIVDCEVFKGYPRIAALYMDKNKSICKYHNMHTGKWWWSTQAAVKKDHPGATIIPIIISSDNPQLTVFGNKTAYPVYMTLGNIPKEIRRKLSRCGYVLLGYLPTSKMKNIKNKAARCRVLGNIFHACIVHILAPLKPAGVTGIPVTSGDGVIRHGHPIYATFVRDYPEQCLVTAIKTGECPTCEVPRDKLGEETGFPLRDLKNILEALDTLDEGPTIYARACADAGIKLIYRPFWEGLSYMNIFRSISPDVLHQLYQGIVKHLISRVKSACGEAEIDVRCWRLPPNHNIRLFMNGITDLNCVAGKEHDQISRFLLRIIIDVQLPDGLSSVRLLAAVCGILDFLHLTQYPMHTSETLSHISDALRRFHNSKNIFVELGIHPNFNLPKLHSCAHYIMYIKLFGTTDNYNTKYTERLHIDLTKDAYRSTNFKDKFPQMTLWLERKEKIFRHEKYIQWHLDGSPAPQTVTPLHPGITYEHRVKMMKHPTHKAVRIDTLVADYGATLFRDALTRFIIETQAASVALHFNRVPVYHQIKYITEDPYTTDSVIDSIHVQPRKSLRSGKDCLAVRHSAGLHPLINYIGYRVAQVRTIFSLKPHHIQALFPPGVSPPKHLTYVKWFSPFKAQPEPHHLMYKMDGDRIASVIPLANVWCSVHLLHKFGPIAPPHWTLTNVLDEWPAFFVNCFSDRHIYAIVF